MELKYIRGRIGFAIFDAGQSHDAMNRGMHEKAVSAGKCTIAVGFRPNEFNPEKEEQFVSVHCYGESSTLGLSSKEEDGKYLEKQLNNYY